MQQRDMERESARCACGRELAIASRFVHQSALGLFVYRRCDCGEEWTEHEAAIDLATPVSADEVLEVHERLEAFAGSLEQLISLPQA